MSHRAADRTRRHVGDLPETEPQTDLGSVRGEGLVPLRMDPPAVQDGLQSIRFTEGLDELTVEAIQMGGQRKIGDEDAKKLAQARARAGDLLRLD